MLAKAAIIASMRRAMIPCVLAWLVIAASAQAAVPTTTTTTTTTTTATNTVTASATAGANLALLDLALDPPKGEVIGFWQEIGDYTVLIDLPANFDKSRPSVLI